MLQPITEGDTDEPVCVTTKWGWYLGRKQWFVGKVQFGVGGVFSTTGCQGTKNGGLGKKWSRSPFFWFSQTFYLDNWQVRLVN